MSLEIRWFFEGDCPPEIINWMKNKNCESNPQDDHYLVIPEPHYSFIGVKKSRGTFDIKYRRKMFELSVKNGTITGKIEDWDKCKLKLADSKNYSFQGITFDQVKINKVRHIKGFDIQYPDLSIQSSEGKVKQGVKLELADINTEFGNWWSLAFDCFADSFEKQKKILEFAIEEILNDYNGPILTLVNSLSYPEWVSKLQ